MKLREEINAKVGKIKAKKGARGIKFGISRRGKSIIFAKGGIWLSDRYVLLKLGPDEL